MACPCKLILEFFLAIFWGVRYDGFIMHTKWNYAIIALVAFVLGFVIARVFVGGGAPAVVQESDNAGVSRDVSPTVSGGGDAVFVGNTLTVVPDTGESMVMKDGPVVDPNVFALDIDDQAAGIVAFLSSVTVGKTSWLVVYEERDGAPGSILGAQRFFEGDYPQGGAVDLLRGMQPGQKYYAAIHFDFDDKTSRFDHLLDIPLRDTSGNMIMQLFTAGEFNTPAVKVESDEEITATASGGCVIIGCGNEICESGIVGTSCARRYVHSCYKDGICERQESGACGWTQTEELIQCLATIE